MPGVFDRVNVGQPLTGIRAESWNAMLASAEAFAQGRPDQAGGGQPLPGAVVVMALNSTGADLREHKPAKVTAAGGYDLEDDFAAQHWKRRPVFTLGVPSTTTDFVVVTLDAIPNGKNGRVVISGPALCDVDSASGATYAAPQAGDTAALLGGTTGTVRVLNVPSAGGSQRRCAVYLHEQPAAAGGSLNTQNTDGTEVDSTTTDLRFDKSTGSKITQSGGVSTHTLLAASSTQWGTVTTASQAFEGEKRFLAPLYRTELATGSPTLYCLLDVNNSISSATVSAVSPTIANVLADTGGATAALTASVSGSNYTLRCRLTSVGGWGVFTEAEDLSAGVGTVWTEYRTGRSLSSNPVCVLIGGNADHDQQGVAFCSRPMVTTQLYDIYADVSEWSTGGSGNTGPLRFRQNNYVADGKAWGATRSGVDTLGADATVSGLVFIAGLYTSGSISVGTAALDALAVTTAKLANNAVTYAKMQAVSAAGRLIGRGAGAGAGDPEEISFDSSLAMSGSTLSVGVVDAGTW